MATSYRQGALGDHADDADAKLPEISVGNDPTTLAGATAPPASLGGANREAVQPRKGSCRFCLRPRVTDDPFHICSPIVTIGHQVQWRPPEGPQARLGGSQAFLRPLGVEITFNREGRDDNHIIRMTSRG
jgi:hypothetical protein